MYKAILKEVFEFFFKFFYNVLGMKKALSISAPCPEVPHLPLFNLKTGFFLYFFFDFFIFQKTAKTARMDHIKFIQGEAVEVYVKLITISISIQISSSS
jgi:hypothetical protein